MCMRVSYISLFLVLLYLLYFIHYFCLCYWFICFFLNTSLSFPFFFLPYGKRLKCHSQINYCGLLHLLTTLPSDLKRSGGSLGFLSMVKKVWQCTSTVPYIIRGVVVNR